MMVAKEVEATAPDRPCASVAIKVSLPSPPVMTLPIPMVMVSSAEEPVRVTKVLAGVVCEISTVRPPVLPEASIFVILSEPVRDKCSPALPLMFTVVAASAFRVMVWVSAVPLASSFVSSAVMLMVSTSATVSVLAWTASSAAIATFSTSVLPVSAPFTLTATAWVGESTYSRRPPLSMLLRVRPPPKTPTAT